MSRFVICSGMTYEIDRLPAATIIDKLDDGRLVAFLPSGEARAYGFTSRGLVIDKIPPISIKVGRP